MNAQRIKKEIRGLLPTWLAVVCVVVGLQYLFHRSNNGVTFLGSIIGFLAGCAVLGAVGFGTEYESHTLVSLLAQPVSRTSLWMEKIMAMCLALLGIYLISLVCGSFFSPSVLFDKPGFRETFKSLCQVGIVPLCAIGATPFLTLATRSTLTGAALSLVLPILLLVDVNWTLAKLHIQLEDNTVSWLNMGLLGGYAVMFGILGYFKFIRLQMIDSRARFIGWSFRLPWSARANKHWKLFNGPIFWLARKEFRLQAITYFISAACVMIWLIYWHFKHAPVLNEGAVLELYTPIIILIAGGISIASERNLGTTALQLTLPVSPFKQWLAKFSVVTLTSLLLGVILPVIVLIYDGSDFRQWDSLDAGFTCFCFALVCLGVFASSISKTPVRGSILGVILLVCCMILFGYSWFSTSIASNNPHLLTSSNPSESLTHAKKMVDLIPEIERWLLIAAELAFAAVAALLGFLNFRNVLPQKRRLYCQIGILFCLVIVLGFADSLALKPLNAELESCIKVVNQSRLP